MNLNVFFLLTFLAAHPAARSQDSFPADTTPVRIPGGVMAARILDHPAPVYPPIALAAHVGGNVALHAIIGANGTVKNLQAIVGPMMLRSAAIDAVSHWRWQPYLLNDQPVPVDTTVTVTFNFKSQSVTAPASVLRTGDPADSSPGTVSRSSGQPVRIAGSVMASRALDAPQPICSPEHKGDAASGTMVLGAIIGADGKVANLNVISGAEWMRGCVLDAVSQWTYKPYLLNGVPTEVETTINIQIGAPATPPQGEPIHVSGGIMAGTILTKGQPPICAPVHKGDHVSGATVLHAIISPDGRVASLKVISGPEAVRACALDSMRQWTYRPYLINGVPVAVETTITLNIGVQPTDDSPPAGSAPVRVSGGVLAGTIINKVQPIYPPEARTQHINGAVVVSVIVGTDGHVKSAKAISGPEMLRPCWEEAVRQWTYKPYLLNGVPVEVQTIVTGSISFGGP